MGGTSDSPKGLVGKWKLHRMQRNPITSVSLMFS
jgi:hypothetical protein